MLPVWFEKPQANNLNKMVSCAPYRCKYKSSLKELNFSPGFKEFPQIKFERTWAHSQKSQNTQVHKSNHWEISKTINSRITSAKTLGYGITRHRI